MPVDWHGFHILPCDWIDKSPSIGSSTPSNAASPTSTSTATDTPAPTATSTETPTPAPTPCARGDANRDGAIDAGDNACVATIIFKRPAEYAVP